MGLSFLEINDEACGFLLLVNSDVAPAPKRRVVTHFATKVSSTGGGLATTTRATDLLEDCSAKTPATKVCDTGSGNRDQAGFRATLV